MEDQPEYVTKTGGVLHPYQMDGEKALLGVKEDCATRTEERGLFVFWYFGEVVGHQVSCFYAFARR